MARPRKHPLPSIAELQARYAYDPLTGEITIRPREGDDRKTLAFNARYAGRSVGFPMNVGYLFVKVMDQHLLAHRVGWALHYGEWPDEIDHKDGNKHNNKLDNLRSATRLQNMANRPGRASSGFKGVKPARTGTRWCAYIGAREKCRYLGTFDTRELAAEAYANAARERYGDFALNPVGTISATVMFGVAA